jgi:hypothetical protein
MSDDDPIPPTLADIRSYGVDVFCWCNRCHHHAVTLIAVLIAHCGPGLLVDAEAVRPHSGARLLKNANQPTAIKQDMNWD